jgi:hypothetical protein
MMSDPVKDLTIDDLIAELDAKIERDTGIRSRDPVVERVAVTRRIREGGWLRQLPDATVERVVDQSLRLVGAAKRWRKE